MESLGVYGERVAELFRQRYGAEPEVLALPRSGSDRIYFRLSSPEVGSVIATVGDDIRENKAFVGLAEIFHENGQGVPAILAVNEDFSAYLQEDLGDASLLSLLSTSRRIPLAESALKALAALQTLPEGLWSDHVIARPFSRRLVMWDLNYFKYEFLKPLGILFDEEALEDDFERLALRLTGVQDLLQGFMYRDFQSRNVIIKDGEPRLIDFQGGRKGPLIYDAVSFLWQAKAGFTDEERRMLLESYAENISILRGVPAEDILKDVGIFALFRTLQVLGAYGFRGLVEKRAHFIESIPAALNNLHNLLKGGVLTDYPELERVASKCVSSRLALQEDEGNTGLTVKVFSFSYKRGYPEDLTGNGGGFMFDCRGMHNPGRYDEYKALTGLDLPVVEFLEGRGEVQEFVKRAFEIVAPSIECYSRRGFRSLQVGFGCTGGRHRSVYCAQRFAGMVAEKFEDVNVELFHREQGLKKIF